MAYGIVHFFPGGTKEQYEATVAAVHAADGSLPQGQMSHAAGASEGGWAIMAIHDSQESWERFRDGTVGLWPRSVHSSTRDRVMSKEPNCADVGSIKVLGPSNWRGSV